MDSRFFGRGYGASDTSSFLSTASAPSLRSSEPVSTYYPTMAPQEDGGNVKVVVRCRAFVKREMEKNAQCLITMDPRTQKTVLSPIENQNSSYGKPNTRRILEEKEFTFDKSFWSHDEEDPHYVDQDDVYKSFGEEFLDHNFDGYHTCIFAYGQTGSGKSYTMMGNSEKPGLIPRTCEALFDRIHNEPSPNTTYNVHVSYFEVYNEHVRDLLVPRTSNSYYLKIRESQKDGVYVQGLTDCQVKSYSDVERLMKVGDLNRTTASTKMNDTSSRSHAVFTIMLKQIQHDMFSDETIERCARMRLVDLAGSERAKATEAKGQRLVEGGKINQSLTSLGRVIAALADPRRNTRKGTREIVPYRDSALTWLLKDSLGGNSKTAMVACIAPSDYDETLSTLRYADQAKRIKTSAKVNQDAISAAERDAKIAELQETIRNLQISVNTASTRKREEATELEAYQQDYQRQVDAMQRLMEETRQVSDAKIRALTGEVEDLRPSVAVLRDENEALRRHLALALGELKNPIVIPPPQMPEVTEVEEEDEDEGVGSEHGSWSVETDPDEAEDLQAQATEFLNELSLFRKKVGSDMARVSTKGDGSGLMALLV